MTKLYDREEHIAELQYEAGMYQSLYENAIAQHAALVKALQQARARIEYLGIVCTDARHFEANASEFLPAIDGVLGVVASSVKP